MLASILTETKLIMLIIQEVEKSSHSEAMPEIWSDKRNQYRPYAKRCVLIFIIHKHE